MRKVLQPIVGKIPARGRIPRRRLKPMCLLQNNPVIYYDFSRYNGYNDKCKKCGDSWSTVVDDAESERLFLQLKKG